MTRKLILILAILTGSLFTSVIIARAQERIPTDDEVNAVAKKLYCPVCPNTPLDVCETKACEDWRAQIREELAAGWTEQQILDYFVEQYGERVLAEPQRKGFTSLVWMLPILAVLLGVMTVGLVLRGWRANRSPAQLQAPIPNISAETIARIEKELKEIE